MNRLTDEPATYIVVRHCTDYGCRKCIARAKWYRRKAWRSGKRPNHRKNGRK